MKNFSPIKRALTILIVFVMVALSVGAITAFASGDETYAVNESFWDYIAVPFGYIMRGCSYITGGIYPLALIFFALAMKIILFPFGIKQQKNSQKQASIRPKEQAIRDKYAGRTDKVTQQKMQQEIQELYQREGFNPMGGCLPLLLQFPILFALFRVVYNPLRHVLGLSVTQINAIANNLIKSGITTVDKLKIGSINYDMGVLRVLRTISPDQFTSATKGVANITQSGLPKVQIFGIDLCYTPMEAIQDGSWWMVLIPIITFASVYFSMKLTRKFTYQPQQSAEMGGCSNKTMDLVMPLMSTFFAVMYPAVLGIYWIYQNILGVLQQIILAKMFPLPTFTQEDYEKAKKELYGRQVKKKKTTGTAKRNPKSLHHIDDDDDDEEPVRPQKKVPAESKEPAVTGNGMIERAPLKEDVPAPVKKDKSEPTDEETEPEAPKDAEEPDEPTEE